MPNIEKPLEEDIKSAIEPIVNEPPDWLPLKFWDAKNGEIRLQALAKSYKLLEKRLSSVRSQGLEKPETTEKPEEKSEEPEAMMEESVDKLVDKSVDKSVESTEDIVNNSVDNVIDIDSATLELEQIFGGADKWQKLRPQLLDWGRRNLPEDAFVLLSSSVEGIKALHGLMRSVPSEPRLVEGGDLPQALDESRLRRMMEDPRYWRERDPNFINRVLRGFQQLYGN